jgi:drug/metabolite transporter (DMT)-like permease
MTERQAMAWVVACALMWSTGGVLSRFFQTTEGFEVTFWRSVFAALTVLVWLAVRGERSPLRQLRSGGGTVWASGLMWAVMFTCFMFSLSLTTVANVLITQSLAPVFTALLAGLVLRRPVAGRTWLAIIVAAAGICLMYVFDLSSLEGRHALGVMVALGIPVAGAINWILLQRAGTSMDLTSSVLLGAVLSILVMRAAARLAAAKTSLLALLEVVFGIALTWLFGGETPGWATVAGGLAVLAALVYNEVGQSRRPAAAA